MEKLFNTEKLFNSVSVITGIIGGAATALFGKWDTILWALLIVMSLDYVTGIIKAAYTKTISSEIGFKGILKKITALAIVTLANVIGKLIGPDIAVRETVIMFYISNEGISVLENVAAVSTRMPDALKNILLQLRDKNNKE